MCKHLKQDWNRVAASLACLIYYQCLFNPVTDSRKVQKRKEADPSQSWNYRRALAIYRMAKGKKRGVPRVLKQTATLA
jgi:hypothetical protein